jgi:nucleoside-diphosphate-sugar epimerase
MASFDRGRGILTKYFVTGATGFIGGRVVRQLVSAGHRVVAVARDPSKAQDLFALGVDVRPGDVTIAESLWSPMTGVDGVFHIAGWYKIGTKDRAEGERVNVLGTRNVLTAMKELRIRMGVYTSTLAVFSDTHGQVVDETYRVDGQGPWLTEYDRTKWAAHYQIAEPMIREGLPLVIVQPGLNYGPGDTSEVRPILVRYLRGRLRALPQETAYCWAHVEDTARGHLLAMEKGIPGESYIIAGPPHSLIEAFQVAERITGIRAPRMHLSPSLLRALARLVRSERLRDVAGVTYLGTNAKARRVLGFDARPLEAGLRDTLGHEMRLLGMKPPDA